MCTQRQLYRKLKRQFYYICACFLYGKCIARNLQGHDVVVLAHNASTIFFNQTQDRTHGSRFKPATIEPQSPDLYHNTIVLEHWNRYFLYRIRYAWIDEQYFVRSNLWVLTQSLRFYTKAVLSHCSLACIVLFIVVIFLSTRLNSSWIAVLNLVDLPRAS